MLGLPTDLQFEAGDVDRAWRRVMERVHPDSGGTDYFAKQANTARDLLKAWLRSGRMFIDAGQASPPPPRPPPPPEPEPRPAQTRQARPNPVLAAIGGLWNIGKLTASAILSLLILAGLGIVAFNVIRDVASKGLAHLTSAEAAWAYGDEREGETAAHLATMPLPSGRVELAVLCSTTGANPAQQLSLVILPLVKSVALQGASFQRAGEERQTATVVTGGALFRNLQAIDGMSVTDMLSALGADTAGLIAKWTVQGADEAQRKRDLQQLSVHYYDQLFDHRSASVTVSYLHDGTPETENMVVKFDSIDPPRDKLFLACGIRNPYTTSIF